MGAEPNILLGWRQLMTIQHNIPFLPSPLPVATQQSCGRLSDSLSPQDVCYRLLEQVMIGRWFP